MLPTSALFGFFCLLLLALTKESLQSRGPSAEFRRHHVTVPLLHRARQRRSSASQAAEGELTVTLPLAGGARRVLDLRLSAELLPRGHTLAYTRRGERLTLAAGAPDGQTEAGELCHYQGGVRGVESSWAALSTCRGLRGLLYDGEHLLYIEPSGAEMSSPHYVYRHEDATGERACGHAADRSQHRLRRRRRDTTGGYSLRAPSSANEQSRYVELALVVDHEGFNAAGGDLRALHRECKDIANIINAMYAPLNIFVALVHVEVWTERDEIPLVNNGDDTLNSFLKYRREVLLRHHRNDNAQLLTRKRFDNGVVGKALKGTMCTYEYSGGINTNHSETVGLVATTIAHEMGHNFGMEHDNEEDCKCPDKKCIMSPSSNTVSPVHWSSCSQQALALSFEHGLDYCLRNKPERLYDMPTCGNGFVEAGEQCDCGGGAGSACAACCHADTCMLRRNATCATGACCDLTTCTVRAAGGECRAAVQECDLPEYCTGHSEFCPDDVYKMDSLPCDNGQAWCAAGSCRSHTDQCRLLWGPSGTQSHEKCYAINRNGTRHGNCGYDRLSMRYERCDMEHAMCGMLHCRHLNEQLEFGVDSVALQSHTFINIDGTIIPCRTALVDLGIDVIDPGLVPDGAKCGPNKMCLGRRCMGVESVRERVAAAVGSDCPSDCSGHGLCNSLGHCHCERGFAPPLCALPGHGGSLDSGPAADPNVQRNFMRAMFIIFLGVVPATLLLLLLAYYSRHNLLLWWRPRKLTGSMSPRAGALQRRLSRGASKLAASLHAPAPPRPHPPPPASPDDISSSLLRPDPASAPHLDFFGHFKGFSLTPLERAQVSGAPTPALALVGGSPAPPAPPAPARAAPPPPADPARPTISSPVLEASTCTAKELVSPLQGSRTLRAAPAAPRLAAAAAPRRPRSVETDVFLKPLPEEPALERPKEGISFNRIASFLKQERARHPVERSHSLPKNPNHQIKTIKIDRTALRNLQISNPILLKDIELTMSTVPAGSDSEEPNDSRRLAGRAQSVRVAGAARPALPAFGSMRQPVGGARPLSAALGSRPTAPPPPRPDPAPPAPAPAHYADCASDEPAPLADIDEESPGDNIYAVIEEGPLARAADRLPVKTIPQVPPVGYNTPKPVGGAGLLGEIVSEIQTRNLDSIYSTSSLARRRRERERRLAGAGADDDDDGSYVNADPRRSLDDASTTSSGYLHPSAVNVPRFLNNNSEANAPQIAPKPVPKPTDAPDSPPPKGPNSKIPTLGRQLTPPGLRPQNSFRNVPPSPKNAPKFVAAKAIANSPDVVSSCAVNGSVKTGKSPDVINSNGNKTPVNETAPKTAAKTTVPSKTTDRPPIKAAPTVEKKIVTSKVTPPPKPASAALKQQSNGTKPIPKVDATKLADNLIKMKPKPAAKVGATPLAGSKAVTRASNVASLQQKFENRKSVGRDIRK